MSTIVMGIVNATPDSFSDGGRYLAAEAAVAHGLELVAQGAGIVDVGGESTRPGAERVEPGVEQERVLPVVEALAARGVVVSVDTMNASTAVAAVRAGARIVNDVSGGLADADMLGAVAASGADIVLGHWRGHSKQMYQGARYGDVVAEVVDELAGRVRAAAAAEISPDRVVLDPGIGFGKTPAQSWELLSGLSRLIGLGSRVLVGTSRKGLLAAALAGPEGDPSTVSPARRDLATAVTSVLAARAGAWGVRVHDVAGTVDALRISGAWRRG